jgi:pre-60S factor REI1
MLNTDANIIGDSETSSVIKEEDEKAIPIMTTLDNLRVCLFCNKESEGIKKNLDHMMIAHTFFILDVDCLINLKGLLGYLAERINLGYICLYCSK